MAPRVTDTARPTVHSSKILNWGDLDLQQLVVLAFKDRQIVSDDHPVVRQLRGLE
jgi:hypothetical protein